MKRTTIALALVLALILPTSATATESRDYMADIITALTVGDVTKAQSLDADRNAKIDRLRLDNPKISVDDLWLVSKIVYAEAGSSWLTDEHQRLVASVLLNRVNSPEFPDDVYSVITQRGQYYPAGSTYFARLIPSERAIKNALYVLENGSIAPPSVVFQSNYANLGSSHYMVIGDRYLGNSYFSYSYNMRLYV